MFGNFGDGVLLARPLFRSAARFRIALGVKGFQEP